MPGHAASKTRGPTASWGLLEMLTGGFGCNRIAIVAVAVLALTCGGCVLASAQGGETVTDVIIGHNKKGPYTLSWTEVDKSSIVAIISGRTLRSSDYAIDNTKGMLSFSSVLLQDAIVRVTYRTTAKSQRTAGVASVPVTLNLFSGPDAKLQVTGIHVQTDPKNPDAAKTIVGLSGSKLWGTTSKLDSQLMVSQENDAAGGSQGSAADRSVIKVGGETQVGNVKFTGSMLCVGDKFGGEKECKLAPGKQASAFAVRFTPGKRVEASASITTDRSTAGANQGAGTVTQEQKVVVSATDTTKVSLAHSTTATQTSAANSGSQVETSQVSVAQQIGNTTSASVSMQNTTVNANGKAEGTTTQQVSVTSKPTDNIGVNAQVQQITSDTQGETVKTTTSVQVKPIKQVSVAATHATQESKTTGLATDTAVSFNASAASSTEIKGTLVQKNTNNHVQYQRDLSLSSRPASFARVTAVFSQKGVDDQQDVTQGAALELTPLKHTRLTAGYKSIRTGSQSLTITDYAASTKPVSFLELSGSYRDREMLQDFAPDTMAVQVAFAPVKFVSVRGTYQENPEDDKGQVQKYEATTAGVQVKVGSIGVYADLSHKDVYVLQQQSQEHSFGLEVPAFGRGKLTTGYRMARLFGDVGTGANTYTMGYRHDLGSVFNISLTGNYTQYRSNNVSARDEYNAQATVGIKF